MVRVIHVYYLVTDLLRYYWVLLHLFLSPSITHLVFASSCCYRCNRQHFAPQNGKMIILLNYRL